MTMTGRVWFREWEGKDLRTLRISEKPGLRKGKKKSRLETDELRKTFSVSKQGGSRRGNVTILVKFLEKRGICQASYSQSSQNFSSQGSSNRG